VELLLVQPHNTYVRLPRQSAARQPWHRPVAAEAVLYQLPSNAHMRTEVDAVLTEVVVGRVEAVFPLQRLRLLATMLSCPKFRVVVQLLKSHVPAHWGADVVVSRLLAM
jgi:hypothetical protein